VKRAALLLSSVLLTGLLALSLSGCEKTSSQSDRQGIENNSNTAALPQTPVADQSEPVEIKGLYVEDPLDFGADGGDVGASKIAIFYKNGDFGSMWVQLNRKGKTQIELRASLDEVVELGRWKESGKILPIRLEKCRCLHCNEDHGDLKKSDLKNPLPLTENWKLEKGNFGETGSIIEKSGKKYHFIAETEFAFANHNEMLAEPLKIKDGNFEEFCVAQDLKDF
jgi:hypothetical protein